MPPAKSWIDVSLPLRSTMPTYPGDPPVSCRVVQQVESGRPESCAVTELRLSSHTGTHVDAPSHFVAGGTAIDELPLDLLVGPAEVVDLSTGPRAIDAAALARRCPESVERLLLKTDNGRLLEEPFCPEYAHLVPSGAAWLRDHGVRLVGIDYLSIEAPGSAGHPVHHALLGATPPVVILEGLDLRRVEAGSYELCVLPLRLAGGDGAPARAIVRPRRPATAAAER